MFGGDVIVLRGGFAVAKLSAAASNEAKRAFSHWGVSFPSGFFTVGLTSVGAADSEDTVDFEFDHSGELEEEAKVLASLCSGHSKKQVRSESESDDEIDVSRI